nr:MAG TPA: Myosin Light Chain/IQ2 AND IQ3-PEPTIDE COMPLEX, IQ MOTIF, MYOSIN.0A [Caudoviricetes sp.]
MYLNFKASRYVGHSIRANYKFYQFCESINCLSCDLF